MFTRIKCKDEQDWLEQRKSGIGGSSCSSIIGLNPYQTNVDYWRIKVGLKQPDDLSNNKNVVYGKVAEDYIRNFVKLDYQDLLEIYHCDYELLVRNDKPFIRASLDGEIDVLQDCIIGGRKLLKGMKGILEIKTTEPLRSVSLESWKDDNVPTNYHCQRLHYLLTTGYDFHLLRCDFRAFYKDTQTWKHWSKDYCILKNEVQDQLDYLEEEETRFWNDNIVNTKEPNLIINI